MLSCLETLVGYVMFLKELIAAAFETSEPLRLNGHPYIEKMQGGVNSYGYASSLPSKEAPF